MRGRFKKLGKNWGEKMAKKRGGARVGVADKQVPIDEPKPMTFRTSLAAGERRSPAEIREAVELALRATIPQQ